MVEAGLAAYGYELDPAVQEAFTKYRKTHNDGVFDAYTPEILRARKAGIITGLPDAYGRGRIIGDYRRVALYGIDRLIEAKRAERTPLDARPSSEDVVRDREELAEQLRALDELKQMAASYGFDISGPARTAREAVQWLYFGYLAAVKEQNGAAMSLGRTSTFLDIYLSRDLAEGRIDEQGAQELVDDLVIKLRIVRFLRTPEYDQLFSGDPTWVTEAIGGMGQDGRTLVTRTSFRYLQTLHNLGPAPEPNLTVLWSVGLPEPFKRFCAQMSIETSSLQYENDDLIRPRFGDDTAIACCVSAMEVGKRMQFFGARVNLAKALLYAINGGRDEITGAQVAPARPPITGDRPITRRCGRPTTPCWTGWRPPTSTRSTSSTTCTTSTPTSASRWHCTITRSRARWRAASPDCRSRPTACRPSSTRRSPRSATRRASPSTTASKATTPPTGTTTTAPTASPSTWSSRSWPRSAAIRRTGMPSTRSRC